MALGSGVRLGTDICRGYMSFEELLDSFTSIFGGIWVGRESYIVISWGLVFQVIVLE